MPDSLTAVFIEVADAVSTAASPAELYDAALTGLERITGVARASILLFDRSGVMRFVAWRGLSDAYRAAVDGHSPWTPDTPAPAPLVVADVRLDESLRAYAAVFEREQIRALAFIPVITRQRVIGKFMLYRETPHVFSNEELGAGQAIAYQIGFAVDRADSEAALAAMLRQESEVRTRLTMLTTASERLLTTQEPGAIVQDVVALAREVVAADAYALWRRVGEQWRVAASAGLSERFTSVEVPVQPQHPFDAPVVAEDVARTARLEERREAYEQEGIQSLVSIPLRMGDRVAGGITFYYRTPHQPSGLELDVASSLGHLAAAAIMNADLHRGQQLLREESELAETRAAFLAEASVILSSLDYEENLKTVARLAVPRLGDWCAVDLLRPGEIIERVAVAHADAHKVRLANELLKRYPTRLEAKRGLGEVLRSGQPQMYAEIPDEAFVASAESPEHLEMLRALALTSVMMIPLKAGERIFGAITFARSTSGRPYRQSDLQFAIEVARRAALAIENARLYRSAQEANRLKDEFLATLSHELRTPLNVILGRARMIHRLVPGPAADAIERNARTLAHLVDDLLDLSRISVGQMRIDARPLRIESVLDATLQGILPAAQAKGVELQAHVAEALPGVAGDATRLQQVMWNLLTNAVKFTPEGGSVTAALAADARHVVLTVTDTGEGIDSAFLPHVFEMFRQEDTGFTRRHGGLGLGLSIVRRLVELHGGHVSAESHGRGRGAVFTVRLPHGPGVA